MAKRICEFLVAFGLVALSCKYDPRPRSGTQICASGPKQCPNGYVCSGGLCRIPTDIIPDASEPAHDAPQVVDGPGGTGSDTTTTTRTATNTGTACGITGRPCCANNVCPGAGSICNAGNCVVCGSSGYVCCAGNTCLGIGTTCSAGNCVPCGASGQPCCAGNLCGATLACIGVTCQPPNPDGGVSTSTGTATARDAGIDVSTTTATITATGTPIVRDAGNDASTATSTGTATATKTKGDAGNDAATSTSTATIRTFPGTGIITSTSISTGTGTGVLPPVTGLTTGTLSAH